VAASAFGSKAIALSEIWLTKRQFGEIAIFQQLTNYLAVHRMPESIMNNPAAQRAVQTANE
jgi:hypothetical protein